MTAQIMDNEQMVVVREAAEGNYAKNNKSWFGS